MTPTPDDHWRRLAADLGLDVGPEPEQPAASIPATEPSPPPVEPAAEDEPSRGRRRRPPPPDYDELIPEEAPRALMEEPPTRGRRGRPQPVADDSSGLFEPEPAEAEVEGADVEAAAVPEVRPDEAEEAGEELAEEQGGKRRRRRRSRRKKKGPESATPGETEARTEAASDESSADEDDDEPTAEVVKNWNVPSWDELIASLHRPER
jgi:hypothetical protein